MHKMKWLYPGMGVKRWLALLFLGFAMIATGLIVLLDAPMLSLYEETILSWVEIWEPGQASVGLLFMALGGLFLALAIRNGIRSVVGAIHPSDVPNLVEHIYKSRNLQKGLNIVTIGGGTGLATMLRGLKEYTSNITAIVTVADDGGSSGRIRDDLGILPPGDVRNTLVALADTEPLMEELFQYRFDWGEGLKGHSFGNLFIAAMTDITGDFEEAIHAFSKVLAVRGKVLPSTLESVRLGAVYDDGSTMLGESSVPQHSRKIKQVFLEPANVQALPEALHTISQADLVVIGPGSLYTSIIPNLLIPGFAQALAQTNALRIYVCNVMTQPGETDGYSASDHVNALRLHIVGPEILDYVVVNQATISGAQSKKYAKEQAHPVQVDHDELARLGIKIHQKDLLDHQDLVRHDSRRLAAEIMSLASLHVKPKNGERAG
ncbi:MAG: YvcK family protein [Limnochordia bacterium]|nr:YvcK family protein [Limnochordia bacterium]